jgi:hypothetical protein
MTGRVGATILVAAALTLSACSDEPPPTWLQGLADEQVPSTTTTVPPPTTTTTTVPQTTVGSLRERTCLVDVSFEQGANVKAAVTIPCRRTHDAEVYAVIDLEEGRRAEFPGAGNLNGRANGRCRNRFEKFVGVPFTKSELDIVTLRPTPESWSEGDRSVVCLITELDNGPLKGSAEGSKT